MDRMLLIYITGAHAKVQSEFLYLETGVIPLKDIISNRRLMYYQNILKKQPNELVRRLFNAQKMNSVKGDWTELVERYLQEYVIQINEKCVENMSKMEFKTIVMERNQF